MSHFRLNGLIDYRKICKWKIQGTSKRYLKLENKTLNFKKRISMSHRAVRVCASAKTALNTTSVLPSSPSVFFIGPIGGLDPWLAPGLVPMSVDG